MREMARQFYEGMSLGHLPMFSLFLFLALFLGVLLFLCVRRKRTAFAQVAALPLNDDTNTEVKP